MNTYTSLEKVTALAKRRGFMYPSSEIYGGMANSWDFGHYGVLLKRNIQNAWLKKCVYGRDDMIAIEAGIFLHPKVWEASGHIENFTDALVDCKTCKTRTRADHLIESALPGKKVEGLSTGALTDIMRKEKIKCPVCGSETLTDARTFNLLFETQLGIIEGEKSQIYLRGELAQGIFINFKNVLDTMRVKIPFGIAQTGKAFRNEITMGQFVHRTMEFDLMELEYFVQMEEWQNSFSMWKDIMQAFTESLGLRKEHIRWREHEDFERAHYSSKTMDMEYEYPFGWKEIFGIAYRSDYDLKKHIEKSGAKLEYKDPLTGQSFVPHVIEPTFGLSRLVGVLLFECYREEEVDGHMRVVLALPPNLAPIKAAVFPLQKDEKLQERAYTLYKELKESLTVEYDNAGNIGKMYRRQDEIGTPFCIAVDYQTLEDGTVTVRFRDTMTQERIPLEKIKDFLLEKFLI